MEGRGELTFAGDIHIDFYTMVGRDQLKLPLVRPVLGQASRKFLLIHVGGSLDDPQTSRQAFPGLNETFQQIFPEETRRHNERQTRVPRPLKRYRTGPS